MTDAADRPATPPGGVMHPRLSRLDDLATSLAADQDVVAVLGLGSAGIEHDRFDDHSDIDFFVIVNGPGAKQRLLADVGWLTAMGTVVHEFVNDPNGRKALFDDGLFVEFAVFTVEELNGFPLVGARAVFRRPGTAVVTDGPAPAATAIDTVEFHLNEALTNLFVGLHRELRGERLVAGRFIQVFAVDRILALNRLTAAPQHQRDPFEATRRIESAHPALVEPLRRMVQGYDHNVESARAVLDWLTEHFSTNPAMTAAIGALIAEAARGTGSAG